jgi:hypothetical protein
MGGKQTLAPLLIHKPSEQVGKCECFFFTHLNWVAMRLSCLDVDTSVDPDGDVLNRLEYLGHTTSNP